MEKERRDEGDRKERCGLDLGCWFLISGRNKRKIKFLTLYLIFTLKLIDKCASSTSMLFPAGLSQHFLSVA